MKSSYFYDKNITTLWNIIQLIGKKFCNTTFEILRMTFRSGIFCIITLTWFVLRVASSSVKSHKIKCFIVLNNHSRKFFLSMVMWFISLISHENEKNNQVVDSNKLGYWLQIEIRVVHVSMHIHKNVILN